jgi:putative oxidoreductase
MFLFRTPTQRQIDLALLLLRLTIGGIFIAHGAQKLFTFGFAGVTGAFGHMGVPMPGFTGPLVALVEFFGGIALVIGLLTRLAAIGLACDMIGAIIFVHFKGGFFLPQGYEYALLLVASNIALILAGAGDYSVDARIGRRQPV